jgi:transcriptional regulator GlxA family with amidase domain
MKIGFLLFDDFEELDFAGPWEIFGQWCKTSNGVELLAVSQNGGTVKGANGLKVLTDCNFANCPQLDVLLIPGGMGTRKEVSNAELISFVQQQSAKCKHVMSVCTGSFILQAAGLLSGKKATTHWASLERLRKFLDVTVVEERFVRDGNVWTSAGVSAGIDLALAFIADQQGEEIAGKVQLGAEYYPSMKRYGSAHLNPGTPKYLWKDN